MTKWKLERPPVVGWNGDDPIYDGPALTVTLAGETVADIDQAYASLRTTCAWPVTPERETLLAVEYAANHVDCDYDRGEFILHFVEQDLPDFLAGHVLFARWRDRRLGGA